MPSSMTGGEPWRSPTPADVAADAYLHEVHAQTVAIYCHECYANAYQRYRTIAHSVTQTRIRDIVPLHEVGPPALRAGVLPRSCNVLHASFLHLDPATSMRKPRLGVLRLQATTSARTYPNSSARVHHEPLSQLSLPCVVLYPGLFLGLLLGFSVLTTCRLLARTRYPPSSCRETTLPVPARPRNSAQQTAHKTPVPHEPSW